MSFLLNHTTSPNRLMVRTYRLRKTVPPGTKIAAIRSLHHHPTLADPPRKDSQNKDDLKPERTEYSKSGTDDNVAEQADAAFNPEKTDPQTQKDTAGTGVSGDSSTSAPSEGKGKESSTDPNPLCVSPANLEVSKQRDPAEGGAQASPRNVPSGRPKSSAKNKKMGTGLEQGAGATS